MSSILQAPLTSPHTPTDIFAALALSPGLANANPNARLTNRSSAEQVEIEPPSAVPSFNIVPPSPPRPVRSLAPSSSLSPSPFLSPSESAEVEYGWRMPGSLPTSRESVVRSADTSYFAESEAGFGFDPMEEEGLNSSYTSDVLMSSKAITNHHRDSTSSHRPSVRSLTIHEARQIHVLLQITFAGEGKGKNSGTSRNGIQGQGKAMMKESIKLAGRFHEVGLRWDRKRRVMGTHLRGVWEGVEGLGEDEKGRVMEYVRGSFVSVAEPPHPLDRLPLAIEMPKISSSAQNQIPSSQMTLQAGLARAVGVPPLPLHLTLNGGDHDMEGDGVQGDFASMYHHPVPETGALTAIERSFNTGERKGLARLRKTRRVDLAIKTGLPVKVASRALQIPLSAASFLSPTTYRSKKGRGRKRSGRGQSGGGGGELLARLGLKRDRGPLPSQASQVIVKPKPKMRQTLQGVSLLKLNAGFKGLRGGKKDTSGGERIDAVPSTARRVSIGGWEVR